MAQLLGRYQLLDRIGIGGMAEVFRARMLGAGDFSRSVVVKRMLPQLAQDRDVVMMFLDEARLGAKLQHPNIVAVLDLGERDGDYYMVLEYVDGVDLGTIDARVRGRGQRFPLEHAAWLIARAAEGLGAAHDARDPVTGKCLDIVHRDVSPSNILVSRSGEVKVADFGVARSTAQQVRTSTGVLKGKVPYMSPEHLLGEDIDARSDVYALGVCLWQLVAGRKRHEGRNDLKIIQSVVQEETPPPSQTRPDIDPVLEEIVMAMVARPRAKRPASAWAAAQLLDEWLATRRFGGRPVLERWLRDLLDTAPSTVLKPPAGIAWPPASDVASVTEKSPLGRAPSAAPEDGAGELGPAGGLPPPPSPADLTLANAVLAPLESTLPTVRERSRWQQLRTERILQNPAVHTRMQEGQAVVIVPARKLMHSLNGTATFIWERADGRHTLQEIADDLLLHFDVVEEVAQDEVLAFVLAAMDNGMLEVATS